MNYELLKTPCYVIDESLLIVNFELLKSVQDRTGCKILLAQKGFSMYSVYPLIAQYLAGVAASSLFEARLGYEEMGKEVHIYSPAYTEEDFDEILKYSNHIIFNSPNEYRKYKDRVRSYKDKNIQCGLRVNPEYSEINTEIYNPCALSSRLGTIKDNININDICDIDGLHFHTMCEQNSDTLERTISVVEDKFGDLLHRVKWLNMGGGHHITRADYDVDKLVNTINYIKNKYSLDVYLEPGEAIALNTGFLAAKVLDIIPNKMDIAILDTSAACHMPDVIEMPYRPVVLGSGLIGEKKHGYRFAGPTCLAGDIIGDYSFDKPLTIGQKVVFTDMAHYTMVKNNTFNGVNLPSIYLYTKDKQAKLIKSFDYQDFKSRL